VLINRNIKALEEKIFKICIYEQKQLQGETIEISLKGTEKSNLYRYKAKQQSHRETCQLECKNAAVKNKYLQFKLH
jgi:hypothetical protein